MGNSAAGKALTPKQARFVECLLVHGNATQAAREAGFSEATASTQANELQHKPHVRAAIEAGRARLAEESSVTQRMVVEGLLKEARDGDSNSARVSAWGLLGKHLGMFSERLDVNHSGTVSVSITRTVRK